MTSIKQLQLLRKIKRNPGYRCTDAEKGMAKYLLSLGYVHQKWTGGNNRGSKAIPIYYIEESGRAYLHEIFTTRLRFTIPVLISLRSLIVSAAALIISLSS